MVNNPEAGGNRPEHCWNDVQGGWTPASWPSKIMHAVIMEELVVPGRFCTDPGTGWYGIACRPGRQRVSCFRFWWKACIS